MLAGWKKSGKKVPNARSEGNETISIELMVMSNKFKRKMMRTCWESNTALKFIKSTCHSTKLIR